MSIPIHRGQAAHSKTDLDQPLSSIHQFLESELTAIANGDLRSSAQMHHVYRLLAQGDELQRTRAEDLGLGLLVNGIPLKTTPCFGIQIAEDLSSLKYFHITEEISEADLNSASTSGRLFAPDLGMEFLMEVKNPYLLSPNSSYLKDVDLELQESIHGLEPDKNRLTFFGSIPTTWHVEPDKDAWAPNIDTVNFIKWLRDEGVFRGKIERSAEIGVGTGLISQALLADNPEVKNHIITDISPWAINASRRNIHPYAEKCNLDWYFGKGIRGLSSEGYFDLIVSNPPYIPHHDGESDVDPYRGTGLIKEIFEVGPSLLNPSNPDAAIYFQCSNLTLGDIARYQEMFPDVELTQIGGPKRVPLRIRPMHHEPDWIKFMKSIGLIESQELAKSTGLRYYHEIYAFKLTRKN